MINGIQQVGVGVVDVREAFRFYRRTFGIRIPVFEEEAVANLMSHYTGGEPRARHAILAASAQGGGALEIWQHKDRVPRGPTFPPLVGDLGIFTVRLRAFDVENAHERLASSGVTLSPLLRAPDGKPHFFLRDLGGVFFEVVQGESWYLRGRSSVGGVSGCMIGVSDIDQARKLYSDVLGYDVPLYDERGVFQDFAWVPGGQLEVRRVLLTHSERRHSTFSEWLGRSQIELIQVLGREPRRIFDGRWWGELGFIHLCFDVQDMGKLRTRCQEAGFPFTVDSQTALSQSFDMGEAAGHFSYIEDMDGTLIEFVETHRIPILKKLNWYLDLRKRGQDKPLPRWMVRALSLASVAS